MEVLNAILSLFMNRVKIYSPFLPNPAIMKCGDIVWLHLAQSNAAFIAKEETAESFYFQNQTLVGFFLVFFKGFAV